ncbi:MAG: hypothetical protein V3581_00765 [Candidatus Cardinium sp.]|uniref:hypothetical protein n=1 Tax=Candidatus Cardinium sp. TP TaxID=2961955 RepID=UPI0021AE351D|nr:hypothetical protein [Candidatus Cardinium sp. TP]MCT4696752.1 hypothetical protein [Candidatus Cardinium sp. TP]MDN5246758.1 hypothetical protein [Candidatus Cardinium sp.]
MSIIIHEFVIRFAVHKPTQPVENTTNKPVDCLLDTTQQQELVKDMVNALLEDREAR